MHYRLSGDRPYYRSRMTRCEIQKTCSGLNVEGRLATVGLLFGGWKDNQMDVVAPTQFYSRRNHLLPVVLSRLVFGRAVLGLNSGRGLVASAMRSGKGLSALCVDKTA